MNIKVNDWVYYNNNLYQISSIGKRGYGTLPGEAEDIIVRFKGTRDYAFDDSIIELWKPEIGDICWDLKYEIPVKIGDIMEGKFLVSHKMIPISEWRSLDQLMPFISEVPDFLK